MLLHVQASPWCPMRCRKSWHLAAPSPTPCSLQLPCGACMYRWAMLSLSVPRQAENSAHIPAGKLRALLQICITSHWQHPEQSCHWRRSRTNGERHRVLRGQSRVKTAGSYLVTHRMHLTLWGRLQLVKLQVRCHALRVRRLCQLCLW